jgi:hypothetical protein
MSLRTVASVTVICASLSYLYSNFTSSLKTLERIHEIELKITTLERRVNFLTELTEKNCTK